MGSEKQLKHFLASLRPRELSNLFRILSSHFPHSLRQSVKQISFKCYESLSELGAQSVSGYGKNPNQASSNSLQALADLLTDDKEMHAILKQSLRLAGSSNAENVGQINFTDEDTADTYPVKESNHPNKSAQPPKEQTPNLQGLNLRNVKVAHPKEQTGIGHGDPTASRKDYLHRILTRNQQLQTEIETAKQQNQKLKQLYKGHLLKNANGKAVPANIKTALPVQSENTHSKGNNHLRPQRKGRESCEPLLNKTKEFLNCTPGTRVRGASVDNGSTKVQQPRIDRSPGGKRPEGSDPLGSEGEVPLKKVTVPKLNLQILPNYHGKSNKSLNQSLMSLYQQTHK